MHFHQGLLNQPVDQMETELVARLALQTQKTKGLEAVATDCLSSLERKWVEGRLSEMRKRLSDPDLPTKERDKLIQESLDLQPKLRNIPALSMSKPNPSAP